MEKCTIMMFFSPKCIKDPRVVTSEFKKAFLRAFTWLFRIFLKMVLDLPGKVLISHNIETFVCDGSDNGVA